MNILTITSKKGAVINLFIFVFQHSAACASSIMDKRTDLVPQDKLKKNVALSL